MVVSCRDSNTPRADRTSNCRRIRQRIQRQQLSAAGIGEGEASLREAANQSANGA